MHSTSVWHPSSRARLQMRQRRREHGVRVVARPAHLGSTDEVDEHVLVHERHAKRAGQHRPGHGFNARVRCVETLTRERDDTERASQPRAPRQDSGHGTDDTAVGSWQLEGRRARRARSVLKRSNEANGENEEEANLNIASSCASLASLLRFKNLRCLRREPRAASRRAASNEQQPLQPLRRVRPGRGEVAGESPLHRELVLHEPLPVDGR